MTEPHRSLSDLLIAASTALTDMAGDLDQVQDVLAEAVAVAKSQPRLAERAQLADRSRQSAAELASALGSLAAQCPPTWTAPVAPLVKDITLAALAARFEGAACEPYAEGGIELF